MGKIICDNLPQQDGEEQDGANYERPSPPLALGEFLSRTPNLPGWRKRYASRLALILPGFEVHVIVRFQIEIRGKLR